MEIREKRLQSYLRIDSGSTSDTPKLPPSVLRTGQERYLARKNLAQEQKISDLSWQLPGRKLPISTIREWKSRQHSTEGQAP